MVAVVDGGEASRVWVGCHKDPVEIKPGTLFASDGGEVTPFICLNKPGHRQHQGGSQDEGRAANAKTQGVGCSVVTNENGFPSVSKVKEARFSPEGFPLHPALNRGLGQFVEDVRRQHDETVRAVELEDAQYGTKAERAAALYNAKLDAEYVVSLENQIVQYEDDE